MQPPLGCGTVGWFIQGPLHLALGSSWFWGGAQQGKDCRQEQCLILMGKTSRDLAVGGLLGDMGSRGHSLETGFVVPVLKGFAGSIMLCSSTSP